MDFEHLFLTLCVFEIHMLQISCLQKIPKESRGPGRGFAWTGGGCCCPGPGIYCAEKNNHGSGCRETLAQSAGSCCLRPPASRTTTINPRGIPRAINPLVSDYIKHARLQVLGCFSLYCCATHCNTSLIREPVSAAIWDWHVRIVHASY